MTFWPPMRWITAAAFCAAVFSMAPGCASKPAAMEDPLPGRPKRPAIVRPAKPNPAPTRNVDEPGSPAAVGIGQSVRGRPIMAQVFDGDGGCVLILGGIHGDELVSTALVDRLARHLKRQPSGCAGRQVILIPRANPDGLADGTRGNARGVDLNRNFRTSNFQPSVRHGRNSLSEPESRALVRAIARYRPSCIVSVHGPLDCVDPDGGTAAYRLAHKMAAVGPVPFKDLETEPGSLGTYAGVGLRLTMITYELDRKNVPPSGVAGYLDAHLAPLLLAIKEGCPE